jgi:hypothetical protein
MQAEAGINPWWAALTVWGVVNAVNISQAAAERISPRALFWLAPLAERLFLEARLRKVWESGWRRLRQRALTSGENPAFWSE